MANMEVFDSYFRRADLDRDGRISGAEAVAFFQGSNLPKQILAQISCWVLENRERVVLSIGKLFQLTEILLFDVSEIYAKLTRKLRFISGVDVFPDDSFHDPYLL
ncbi:hypothetical protein ACLOJK_002431 [Asimina triloba]